jgi:hypothetical protein
MYAMPMLQCAAELSAHSFFFFLQEKTGKEKTHCDSAS